VDWTRLAQDSVQCRAAAGVEMYALPTGGGRFGLQSNHKLHANDFHGVSYRITYIHSLYLQLLAILTSCVVVLDSVMVSVLATVPKDRGFKPAKADGF
jgi:hypothetical protein